MKPKYIVSLMKKRLPASVGNKAQNLRRLQNKGFAIPVTYVCTWEAYQRYVENDVAIVQALESELAQIVEPGRAYAVRSSANLEDDFEHSFAGQFKSVLDVIGVDKILQAIWSIWATTCSPEVLDYLEKTHRAQKELRMAVIIQEMVKPAFSGVAFSKHPITGLDETVVEAVPGRGDALMQGGATPFSYVNKWGKWIIKPEEGGLDLAVAQELVDQTRTIARAFRKDIDLEWVHDGRSIYWVQMREITSIKNVIVYSNAIAKEQLPGMIKPLVWSLNVPLVCGAWKNLITEMIGENDIDVMSLAKSFYYRAYFNMGVLGQVFNSLGLPRESLEMMMGIGPAGVKMPVFRPNRTLISKIPRLLRLMWDKWNFSPKVGKYLAEARRSYQQFSIETAARQSELELSDTIDRLFALNQKMAYYSIVGPLLMFMYNMIVRSQIKKAGVDPDLVDLTHGMDELKEYDPNASLLLLNQQFNQLDEQLRIRILTASYEEFEKMPGITGFREAVTGFFRRFGHLSNSGNDISVAPWRENPDLILKLITSFQCTPEKTGEMMRVADVPARGGRRMAIDILHRRAQKFRLHREQISSLYTYGYGLFRVYFLALAEHFVRRGFLVGREDIFYLTYAETRQVVKDAELGKVCAEKVCQRKEEMERYRNVVLPSVIYGEEAPPVGIEVRQKLVGVPTSRGYFTGPVRVVQGLEDFQKLQNGDILVVPYSDVGWTPLFARAGGVISESGGMLSHSSIIAREYKIPAVVSVAEALFLTDNTIVTIDGYKGEVIVHASEQPPSVNVAV